jgi:hypothetical protein
MLRQPCAVISLDAIENLNIPTLDEVEAWAAHMAYCQFTEARNARWHSLENIAWWLIVVYISSVANPQP